MNASIAHPGPENVGVSLLERVRLFQEVGVEALNNKRIYTRFLN